MANIKGVKAEEIDSGKEEIYVDFRNKTSGELIIKVRNLIKGNKQMEERVKLLDKDHLNILHIFVDTVSRNNFFRKYKKTSKFLQENYHSEKKKKRVYEFHRLHSIRGYTFPNLFASTYGMAYDDSWSNDHLKRIDSYAKDAGYIVGMTSDCCTYPESEVKWGGKPYNYSDTVDADHMMYQLACDYNSMPKDNPLSFGFNRGPYAVSRKCLFKRDLSGASLEYMEKFFDTYKDYRKFFTARIIAAHEFTGENNHFIDPQVEKYLRNLDAKGHLDDTIVWIYSDHGDHINFIMWNTESGYSELMNPPLFVMIPDHLDEKIGENLKYNEQKLLTHYEIF